MLFVEAYISNGGNATQAGVACGFSPKTAYSTGQRMLKHAEVVLKLRERQAELAKKYELTTDSVIKSLAQAVHFDPRKMFRGDGTLKHPTELDDDTASALASFEVTEEFDGAGSGRVQMGFTKKIKWLDKNTAREQAMKHLGLYQEDNKQRNPFEGISRDTLKQISERLRGKA